MFKKDMNPNTLLPRSTQGSNTESINIEKTNFYDTNRKFFKSCKT